jgi:hypothetical protein
LNLIQLLLPIYRKSGKRVARRQFDVTRAELTKKFGGLTTYSRAPAKGFWKKTAATEHDDIVVFEVMAKRLDARWWKRYRHRLEERFDQDEIVVRSTAYRKL